MKMEKKKYKKAREELDDSFAAAETAADYLQEIMRIWTEHGFLAGEWHCVLKNEEAV